MVVDHYEHYCGMFPDKNSIPKYLILVADWDCADFEETRLNPVNIIEVKSVDEKCMNVSNKFQETNRRRNK